ncbi:MAG: hypothetical protein FWF14_03940 [Streptococcaceae bacterium]|jgi:hypothetical protein|nr:hypothetical protein [Streptococcaceae bacterium]
MSKRNDEENRYTPPIEKDASDYLNSGIRAVLSFVPTANEIWSNIVIPTLDL